MHRSVLIKESHIRDIIRKALREEAANPPNSPNDPGIEEVKLRCTTDNIASLDKIVGSPNDFKNYTSRISRRIGGIKGIIDALELLKTLRLHPELEDKGEHLAYDLLNQLKEYNNKNYYDEVTKNCIPAMEKVVELYKEDENGEELIKDIEKVLAHPYPSQRAKEYLKQCLVLGKGDDKKEKNKKR